MTTTAATPAATSPSCGVYFAPSTIPGGGWGAFAAHNFDRSSHVLPGDLIVPLQELSWHNGYENDSDKPDNLWIDYYWLSEDFEFMEEEGEWIKGVSFGLGSAVNCYYPLLNMEAWGDMEFDRAGIGRDDPGAGSFTPYHNRPAVAKLDIEAGSELFVTYGENYFSEWLDDPTKPVIPNNAAYRNAKSVLTKLVAVLYRAVRTSAETKAVIGQETKTINEISDIWDSVTDPSHEDFDLAKDLLDVLDSMAWTHRSVFLETMPKTPEQIPEVYKNGLKHRDFKRSQRSIEELQEIGVCMDNIEEGLSTIPHAGRGGFARRNLTQGTVVTPIPLLHFGDRSFYDMYPGSQTVEGYIPDRRGSPIHQQLIVNYCFGHKQSTLLLCHYGSGAGMINHSKEKANVRLQWLSVPGGSPEWRDMALSEWTATKKAGIVMELVATRDIAAGEEILMDYGDDWADAFSRHVANWKPPPEAAWYRPADELNDDPDVIVRTQQEGGYDWFLDLYCRNYYRQAQFLAPSSTVLHRCHVTERRWTPNGYRYTAVIFDFDDLEEDELQCQLVGTTEILFDVPRDAFVFDDTMYSRDHQQPWAFRHPIGIPDYMMPEAWKNLE